MPDRKSLWVEERLRRIVRREPSAGTLFRHVISSVLLVLVGLWVGSGDTASAEAMQLARPESRWVAVRVVTSNPSDSEHQLSDPILAWYEAGPGPNERRVTIPGSMVERILFSDRNPVDQSFSDFVWVFDARTGHVESASLSGLVDEPIHVGPFRSSARVSIVVDLSSRVTGGFGEPRKRAGRSVIGYCEVATSPDCTPLAGSAYDADSGWVRANGGVCAVWHSLRTLAYTPLGQARFLELDASGSPSGVDAARGLEERRPSGKRESSTAC